MRNRVVGDCPYLTFERCCRSRLAAVQASFEDWVVLGKVDMEELIATYCQTYEDFEQNFKMVKLKGGVADIFRRMFSDRTFFFKYTNLKQRKKQLILIHKIKLDLRQ